MKSLKLLKLQTQNFRNIESKVIEFSSGINCIFGKNGNGKTNILEAIHVLITRKSFRKNASFPQFLSINGDNPEIYISSVFDQEGELLPYSGKIYPSKSEWFQAGAPIKKKPEVGIVFINPFDAQGFHTTASTRRAWIDTHLSQLDPIYKKSLSRYTAHLRGRNTLLSKKPNYYRDQIRAIDQEISPLAFVITQKRIQFLKELGPFCEETFKKVFSESHTLSIQLDTRLNENSENTFFNMLQERLPKDEIIGHTSYGIHKDDYVLLFDGLNSFDYCSLGQQKMAYLSLLFAYIELFRYKFTSFPIVLLDDVSGELDSLRWNRLVNYLEKSPFQIFITTANEKFKEELDTIQNAHKILIDNGCIFPL